MIRILCCATLITAAFFTSAIADEPPKLPAALQLEDLALGGFVGRLSTTISIEPNGKWTMKREIGRTPRGEWAGELSAEQVAELLKTLKENDFDSLPELVGPEPKEPTNNAAANVATIVLGDKKVVLSSNSTTPAPKPDSEAGKQQARIQNIVRAIHTAAKSK